jgi:hypothetical protein
MIPEARRRSSRWPHLRSEQVLLLVVAVVAVPAIVWAGIRIAGRGDDSRPRQLAGEPGISHVHGLGINPADGALIVATHFDSFRVPPDGDEAVRIGDSFQDTMGFTVAGPDHFLGSGHPDVEGVRAGPRRGRGGNNRRVRLRKGGGPHHDQRRSPLRVPGEVRRGDRPVGDRPQVLSR